MSIQVSFRIDAASYGSFVRYAEVIIRQESASGTVVVTCAEHEVQFRAQGDPSGSAWSVQRKQADRS